MINIQIGDDENETTVLSEPAYGNKIKKECSSGLNPDLPAKIQGIFQCTEDS